MYPYQKCDVIVIFLFKSVLDYWMLLSKELSFCFKSFSRLLNFMMSNKANGNQNSYNNDPYKSLITKEELAGA